MNIYWNEEYCAPETDFDTFKKSRHIAELLNTTDPCDRVGSLALARTEIEKYTSSEYLQAVMTGNPRALAETNGFEWDDGVYHSVLNSTAGILCAADDVMDYKNPSVAGSLSSGLHHANSNRGLGFCTINSLAIGALYVASKGRRVAILDLDAHFGGGTTAMIKGTKVAQFDLSTSVFDDYPETEMNPDSRKYFCNQPESYLKAVSNALDELEDFSPEVVLYNAGVDVYPQIPWEMVVTRELSVAKRLAMRNSRVVIVTAGGYGDYTHIAKLHSETFRAFGANIGAVAA
jgi:acetoin utilization deacetylase AcuC-like enzyme